MSRITVRFFKIEKIHQSAPDLEAALLGVFNSGDSSSDRERSIHGQTLRLERLTEDNSFYDGEIVRKQVADMPPEANNSGLTKLPVSPGGGIGHCIAFRYSVTTQVIAIQFDNRTVSINKFLAYLKDFDPTYSYRPEPMVRKDAWEKYNQGLPTKFAIEIAQPQNLEAVEGEVGSAIASAQNLADIANGPIIYIEVKMGRKKGSLAKQSVDSFLEYFRTGDGHTQDVRKLCATTATEDGSEMVNFLHDFLREQRDIEVPEGEPDAHYTKRQACVTSCFLTHFAYIQEVYGASGVVTN